MARKITAGIIHPVTIFDGDGNLVGGSIGATAQAYSAGNASVVGANTAATVTLAAPGAGRSNVIAGIYWSYDAAPTGGSLTIDVAAITVFTIYVTDRGAGFFPFDPPIQLSANSTVVVTLAAAGAAVTGSLNVHAWAE